jgi:hypothetical protein
LRGPEASLQTLRLCAKLKLALVANERQRREPRCYGGVLFWQETAENIKKIKPQIRKFKCTHKSKKIICEFAVNVFEPES